MKVNKLVFVVITAIFVLSSLSVVLSANAADITVTTDNQCTTPTKTVNVEGDSPDVYNVSKITVDQGACVQINFKNADSVDHTFSILADTANNVTYFNIYATPGQTVSSNFKAPSADVTLQYFCQVTGHKDAGMYGSLVVGAGSKSGGSSPGFEMVPLIFGLVAAAGVVTLYKRRRN